MSVSVVKFNDGEKEVKALRLDSDGPKSDLLVLEKGNLRLEEDVPRRAPSDYDEKGGGRTFHA
jgi:hypothetical protein